MPESVVYLNGRFVPRSAATLDIEDRGALFADGVYEVLRYYGGKPLAMDAHIARLRLSLEGIQLAEPAGVEIFSTISDDLVRRNNLRDAKVYWQVTRGGGVPRGHTFPKGLAPTVLMIAYPAAPLDPSAPPAAATAILHEDLRWHRCSIKSLMLLPNVLAMNKAVESGANEAVLHRDGVVTECTATSLLIARGGELHTHPADHHILGGITRAILLDLARADGLVIHERPFTVDELWAADEAILCGTTTHVAGLVKLDGKPIGGGAVGKIAQRLHGLFVQHVDRTCLDRT